MASDHPPRRHGPCQTQPPDLMQRLEQKADCVSRLEATSLQHPSPPRCPPNKLTASGRSDMSSNTTQLRRRARGQVQQASSTGVPGTRASSLTPLGPDTPPAFSLSKAQRPLSQSGTVPCLSDPTSPKEAAGQTSKMAAGRGAQTSSWGGC